MHHQNHHQLGPPPPGLHGGPSPRSPGLMPPPSAMANRNSVKIKDPFLRRMDGAQIVPHAPNTKLLFSELQKNKFGKIRTDSVKSVFSNLGASNKGEVKN